MIKLINKTSASGITSSFAVMLSAKQRTLATQRLSVDHRICLAASDYRAATARPEFAAEFGGVEKLRNELFELVAKWGKGNF